jgi:hypothetical protein
MGSCRLGEPAQIEGSKVAANLGPFISAFRPVLRVGFSNIVEELWWIEVHAVD